MPDTDETTDAIPIPTLTLGGSPWAIRPDVLPRVAETVRAAATPAWMAAAEGALAAAPSAARRPRSARAGGAVAVLALTGILTPRGSVLSMLFGGGYGGLQDFRDEFAAAVASPDVGSIVIDVDSPGGLVSLVPETAAEIRAARGTKPIIAVANTQAASAAYWIAAQADEVVVTPSGMLGSIGVYIVHEDWSAFNEKFGVDPTWISAGRYKTEGNPDEPLGDDARAAMQQDIDDLYAMFVNDVAAGRDVSADTVISDYGEGRCLYAARAVEAGLADRVATIETVIAELLGSDTAAAAALAAAPAATEPVITPPAPVAIAAAARDRLAGVLLG